MKRCPVCDRSYPDDANFCPMDAGRLALVADVIVQPRPALDSPTTQERVVGGRYHLGAQIGGHRTGQVFLASDGIEGSADLALKLISPRVFPSALVAQRTERELKQLMKVASRRVVKVRDVGKQGEQLWVATELCEGESLAALIARRGALPLGQALRYTLEIGEALAEAAKLGVIHRDVAPKNVIVVDANDVKVLNFGVPTPVDTGPGRPLIFGVAAFMSPEQAEGKPVDQRSNIYSLGLLLYFMLAGEPPFAGSVDELLRQHVSRLPPSPNGRPGGDPVPPEVERVLMKALEKSSSRRHMTLRQFLGELEGLLPLAEAFAAAATVAAPAPAIPTTPAITPTATSPSPSPSPSPGQTQPALPVIPPVVIPPAAHQTLIGMPEAAGAIKPRPSRAQALIVPEPQASVIVESQSQSQPQPQPPPKPRAQAQIVQRSITQPPAPVMSRQARGQIAGQVALPGMPLPLNPPKGQGTSVRGGGRRRKGKFRDTMWFKKGELDQVAAAEAAKPPAKPNDLPVTDRADELPIEDRYGDDGSLSAEDQHRLSLHTGATQMNMPASRRGPALPGAGMNEDELLDELGGSWPRLAAIIGGVVVLAALIVYFVVVRK